MTTNKVFFLEQD